MTTGLVIRCSCSWTDEEETIVPPNVDSQSEAAGGGAKNQEGAFVSVGNHGALATTVNHHLPTQQRSALFSWSLCFQKLLHALVQRSQELWSESVMPELKV